MRKRRYAKQIDQLIPATPRNFQQAMQQTMADIERDAPCGETAGRPVFTKRRVAAAVLVAALVVATAALAATHWNIFDALDFVTGPAPKNADEVMQANLYQTTVNNVEITVREAGYDGRTLFVQYAYRMLDVDIPMGDETGNVPDSHLELLDAHGVGWWRDCLWLNGKCIPMPEGSGSVTRGSTVPGEIIQTEYWRLDQAQIELNGLAEISLPIAERQNSEDYSKKNHPEKYGEDGGLLLPDAGVVTFTLDTADSLSRVHCEHPDIPAQINGVTVRVSEACYSPLMTYLTLSMEGGAAIMDDVNGDNGGDGSGLGSWIVSLELVDGNGTRLFPEGSGERAYSSDWAEVLYPHMDTVPEILYLAPVENGTADMGRAVRVK